MSVFDEMLDALYDSEIGIDATYHPLGGAAKAVRVMRAAADTVGNFGDLKPVIATDTFKIRKSEIALAREGDVLVIGETRREVQGAPQSRDTRRLEWWLDTKPAA